jgi:hypothetical protein
MNDKLPSPIQTTLQDLRSTAAALERTDSPSETRQLFLAFLNSSQSLTDHMRREYKHLTGTPWLPGGWIGWTAVTDLVKGLRRHYQHEFPLLLLARVRYYYSITPAADSPQLVIQGDWAPLDPQDAEVPDGLSLHLADPKTGVMTDQTVTPSKREFQLVPLVDDPKLKAQLSNISETDVRAIVKSTLAVLEEYVALYIEQLAEHHL